MSVAQPTLDDVWLLFRETDRKIKQMSQETNQQFQRTDRKIKQLKGIAPKPKHTVSLEDRIKGSVLII